MSDDGPRDPYEIYAERVDETAVYLVNNYECGMGVSYNVSVFATAVNNTIQALTEELRQLKKEAK